MSKESNNGISNWGQVPKPKDRITAPVYTNRYQRPTIAPMTEYTYEEWTIVFQEVEPFTWYITHTCVNVPVGMAAANTPKFPYLGEDTANCVLCKAVITPEQFKVLRSTQKLLCRVAR